MATVVITKDNFEQTVAQNEIVLLDFWAQWCGPCKSFATIYEETAKKNPNIIFGKINVDEERELASDFHIHSIPTTMILRQSVVVFSQSGTLSASALQGIIDQAKALDMTEVHKKAAEQQKKT